MRKNGKSFFMVPDLRIYKGISIIIKQNEIKKFRIRVQSLNFGFLRT
jgi:hypothetical protein